MKIGYCIVPAGFISLFLLSSTPVIAKPVTAADLTGKTLCSSVGDKETYLRGGKYVSKGGGSGTWQLLSEGVVIIKGQSWDWVESIEKLPDGTFNVTTGSVNGYTNRYVGHYCN